MWKEYFLQANYLILAFLALDEWAPLLLVEMIEWPVSVFLRAALV
ncbi:hypothetical protein KDK_60450 [Dictyobacter kobayashii]|uniref:Uncharacterized protein n=1 Tax=Dictyobacter kobayashii TaxID=2014872 RepID=A0A402AT37_9CHLR|nr:hypothetical protein KDK_60450 [Dictyobacter kobayashii]